MAKTFKFKHKHAYKAYVILQRGDESNQWQVRAM